MISRWATLGVLANTSAPGRSSGRRRSRTAHGSRRCSSTSLRIRASNDCCGPRQLELLDVAFHDLGQPLACRGRGLREELDAAVASALPRARASAPVAPFEQPISRIEASAFVRQGVHVVVASHREVRRVLEVVAASADGHGPLVTRHGVHPEQPSSAGAAGDRTRSRGNGRPETAAVERRTGQRRRGAKQDTPRPGARSARS